MTITGTDTRDRIRREAATLYRKNGFHGTSMQDLATVVGITKSSLYHHYPSKQALLSEIVEATVARVAPLVRAAAESDRPAVERLHLAVHLHTVEAIRDQDAVACFIEEGRHLDSVYLEPHIAKRDLYEQYFRRILQEGVTSGEFRPLDVPLTAMAILGLCNSVVRWFRREGKHTSEEIANEFADLAVRGVIADPADHPTTEEAGHVRST